MSSIEWTDETWNPTVGCSRVSPGCDNCYAMKVAHRGLTDAHRGLTFFDDSGERRHGVDWTGEVRCLPDRLDQPLRWRKPRRVFVDSMSDLFHPDVPDDFIARVFAVMGFTSRHTFQVLTKRPQRMAQLMSSMAFEELLRQALLPTFRIEQIEGPNTMPLLETIDRGDPILPFPNVWLGVSVEDQRYADLRIPHLLATPAAVRFLSIEPLLGPVDLRPGWWLPMPGGGPRCAPTQRPWESPPASSIDWVIAGGESGPGARPMHPGWARSIRDQCTAAGVPFFFKQGSGPRAGQQYDIPDDLWAYKEFPREGATERVAGMCK